MTTKLTDSELVRKAYLESLSEQYMIEFFIVQFFADEVFSRKEDNGQLPKILMHLATLDSNYLKVTENIEIDELLLII